MPVGRRTTSLALLVAAAAAFQASVGSALAAGPQWPTNREFARDSVIPSLPLGETYRGWIDNGGGWITDAGPGGSELWQLYFERDGAATVVIVTPDSYTDDGSVAAWRVRDNLLIAAAEDPILWAGCWFESGDDQPIYARWSEANGASDIWTFDPQTGEFRSLTPAEVFCEPEYYE